MSHKTLTQGFVLIVLLVAILGAPGSALAWSSCGASYVVQWGDTLGGIAARCGTTVAALYAANPGISGYLYAGQLLYMPGSSNACNCSQTGYAGTYTVQYGDTFALIAQRFGVSIYNLWAANPQIRDINYIYAGQVIYVPGYTQGTSQNTSWFQVGTASSESQTALSYGSVLPGTHTGSVKLINIANAQVYVSLQGTTADGAETIHEYPVEGSMKVKVPAGWFTYVAWVGGQEFAGQFQLHGDETHTITFYPHRVNVQ